MAFSLNIVGKVDPRNAKNKHVLLTFGPALSQEGPAKRASQPSIGTHQGRVASLAQEDGSGDHMRLERHEDNN